MLHTLLYYLLAFFGFILCIAGLQKWNKLQQTKKDKIGFVVLSVFLTLLIAFVGLVLTKSNLLKGDDILFTAIIFFFLTVFFLVLFLSWYNQKYNRKINISTVVVVFCLTVFVCVFLFIKQMGINEEQNIIKNIELKTVVKNIIFDTHKPYFKEMVLDNKQTLPMPEAMNDQLQVGDSIFKNKKEDFYTVVKGVTHDKQIYKVKVNMRILGKQQ